MTKNYLILFVFYLLYLVPTLGQNGIIGEGFSNGWTNGGDCNNNSIICFGSGAGGSRILTIQPTGTGDRFFRMVRAWGGNWDEFTSNATGCNNGNENITSSVGTELSTTSGNCTNGAFFINAPNTSDNYIFKTRGGTSNSLVFFKVEGIIRSISSVSQNPSTVYLDESVTVTATLDGSFATGQAVFLRYSTNSDLSSSTVVKMTGAGTTYTATIPGQSSGGTIYYYLFTSGDVGSISGNDADFYTINLNNGGSNYSYTVQSSKGTYANGETNPSTSGTCDGSWNDGDCWTGGSVPASGASVTINDNLILDQDATVNNITISSGATFSSEGANGRTLNISSGGSFTNNGTFTANDGTVNFQGTGTVTGSPTFNNADVNSGHVNFGGATVNGILQILSSGIAMGSVNYGNGSTLRYSSSESNYQVADEWINTPYNVEVNSPVTLINFTKTVTNNMTVNSSFTMNPFTNPTSGDLIVGNDLTVNGTFTISNGDGGDGASKKFNLRVSNDFTIGNSGIFNMNDDVGDDLYVGGEWENNGNFNPSSFDQGRAIFLNGSDAQMIMGSSPTTFPYLFLQNGMGEVTLGQSITITVRIDFASTTLDIAGNNATIQAAATVTGVGDASNMFIATGAGQVRKEFNSTGTFIFPVGDANATKEYSPVTFTLTGTPSFSGNAYIAVNLRNSKLSANSSIANYLNRYWTVSENGISNLEYNIVCQYTTSDVSGIEASIRGAKYDGASVEDLGMVDAINHLFSASGLTTLSDFTGVSSALLPVQLKNFSAEIHQQQTHLSWQTTSELNNSHFLIQRSKDSKAWHNIGEVKGAGTTDEPQDYTYTDKSPLQGLNYYRLKQVDYDGAYDFSKVVSVDMRKDDAVLVYPNPAKDEVWLEFAEERAVGSVLSIYNITGQLVQQFALTEKSKTLRVSLEELNNGIYLLQIKDKTGQQVLRETFIKQ